jgi:hypothetical protein
MVRSDTLSGDYRLNLWDRMRRHECVILCAHFGITGVPWATIITYLLLNALPVNLYIPVFIKKRMISQYSASTEVIA